MKINLISKISLIVLLLLAFQNSKAQTNVTKDQTLLWKISGNGLQNDSYILLTTTNTCVELTLSAKTVDILSKVRSVTFETSLGNPVNEAKMKKLVMVKDEKRSIKRIISTGLYTQLLAEAEKVGINEVTLNTFHPVYISGLSIQLVNPCQIPTVKTTDQLLRAYAKNNNLKISELTSPEENFEVFESYPNNYWERTLSQLIKNSADVATDLDNKTDFYKHENLRGVCAVINKSPLLKLRYSYPDIESKKIDFIKSRLETKIKNQSSLVQLDISDVANPVTSIFNALTKSGYVISPVFN